MSKGRLRAAIPDEQLTSSRRREIEQDRLHRRGVHIDRNDGDGIARDVEDLTAAIPKPQLDATFGRQPLEKNGATAKLTSLIKEWHNTAKMIQESMNMLANATGEFSEALAGDADADLLNNEVNGLNLVCWRARVCGRSIYGRMCTKDLIAADSHFRQLVDRLNEASIRQRALEDLRHRVQVGEAVVSVALEYCGYLLTQYVYKFRPMHFLATKRPQMQSWTPIVPRRPERSIPSWTAI